VTDIYSGMRRYLALWFPFLPADRLRRQDPSRFARSPDTPPDPRDPAAPDAPFVFIAKIKGAQKIVAVDARAQALGLCPGLTLADARARHPDLVVFDQDHAADQHWLERLARRCTDYSPLVMLVPPDGITIDIAGSDHLFGGEAALAETVEARFADLSMTLRHAVAATAEGAQALARFASLPVTDEKAALRALPVVALGLDPQATLALQRAGLKRVGDVSARSAASLAARFGAEAPLALRRLMGDVRSPILPLAHKAPLLFERRFAEPIAHQAAVAEAVLTLMQDAARALEERAQGGRRFHLSLFRSDGAVHRLVIETGAPTRDPALVLRLFDERIGALADPLDPGFGYDSITLAVPATEPLAPTQGEWGKAADQGAEMAELIARLSTRLGPGRVRQLAPQDSHVPEQAQLAFPAIEGNVPTRWSSPAAGEPPMRPLFLFNPPQPVEVIAEVPDGPPHRFRWRRKVHEVRLFEGPERIASEWWRRKSGERPGQGGLTRDYYRIEDVRGRRYWIFRHGLYDEKPDPRWYLHGLFA
jgi:protein ImuB